MCVRRTRPQRTLALAAGTLLAAVVACLLFLGAGTTQAAQRSHHHHRHHQHHQASVHIPNSFLGLLPGPTPFTTTDIAKIAKTHVRNVRLGLPWYQAQPARGAPFRWGWSDAMVANLAAKGITVLPTLGGTPLWAAPKGTTPPIANESASTPWQRFVTAIVNRYGNGGSFWRSTGGTSPFHRLCHCGASPKPIKAWQIWNEPNLAHYFTDPSPKRYAKLVQISRSAIKQADPTAKVVLAGLSDGGKPGNPGAVPYLKKLYRIPGFKKQFDAVAIHPYAKNIDDLKRAITRFRTVMKQKHDQRTPLWVSEVGWGSGHPNRYGHNKGISGQKKILQQALTMLANKRKAWHLAHVYWFYWRDPPKTSSHNACSFCTSAGLLKNNGRPKPAYKAFRQLAR